MPRPSRLAEPLAEPSRVKTTLAQLGIESVGDLLEHLPFTHRDRRELTQIASLRLGEEATVEATVRASRLRPMRDRRKKRLDVRVADESGPMVCVWFNQPWLARYMVAGTPVRVHGKLRRRGEFWVTEYELLGSGPVVHTEGLVPVYPATAGLSADRLRAIAWGLRDQAAHTIDCLPARLRVAEGLCDRASALLATHFPQAPCDTETARVRLAFEELFLLELALESRHRARAQTHSAPKLCASDRLVAPWRSSLGFSLTEDQLAACAEIDSDLAGGAPMQRLLMGEVGSGKTVVAVHAMLRAAENGCQAALMAPTETLAEQHAATVAKLLRSSCDVECLTGSTPAARRREICDRLAAGGLLLVVGTHALLESDVEFARLAVCVIDEQHRFGVAQRAALESKAQAGLTPHALHMTATPIPRTLALTAYGDLDVTCLRELPAGRQPVSTWIAETAAERSRAYEHARVELDAGRQCFVVCPLVTESDSLQAKAATEEAQALRNGEFAGYRVELIHGQLRSQAKSKAMRAFAAGHADVLVATSVIEVGIDVPNATVMLVEQAERYGISQLHQLRGRIGRGPDPASCVLFTDRRLERLEAVANERNGFELAEVDLRLRGAGEALGTRQHGLERFKVAQLPADYDLLERARHRARELLEADPQLLASEHELLRAACERQFGSYAEPIPA